MHKNNTLQLHTVCDTFSLYIRQQVFQPNWCCHAHQNMTLSWVPLLTCILSCVTA